MSTLNYLISGFGVGGGGSDAKLVPTFHTRPLIHEQLFMPYL